MSDTGVAGASAARNKLARYLRECGVRVQESDPACPPKDIDFIKAIAIAMRRPDFERLAQDRKVVFSWGHATFKVPIPEEAICEVEAGGLDRYEIFDMDSQWGSSHYYLGLGLGSEGKASVFRFKRWSGKAEELETSIE